MMTIEEKEKLGEALKELQKTREKLADAGEAMIEASKGIQDLCEKARAHLEDPLNPIKITELKLAVIKWEAE